MNGYQFMEAMNCLDLALIEEHISMSKQIKKDKIIKKRTNALKRTIVASCVIVYLFSSVLMIDNLNRIPGNNYTPETTPAGDTALLPLSLVLVVIGYLTWLVGAKYIKRKYRNYSAL